MKFIHTADWQLGKPYARIENDQKRALVQQERFAAIDRIAAAVKQHDADFVLVAGDLFDSVCPTREVVSSACSAIGKMGVPVVVIPGNHDHGGAESVWHQAFFQKEKEQLAPNMQVILKPEPVQVPGGYVFCCPMTRRAESQDTTLWLRQPELLAGGGEEDCRIILAHGSTQSFGSRGDEESGDEQASNIIDLSRLVLDEYDYAALGDWHGTKQVGPKAWYSGTPEPDRFPKGEQQSGQVLLVELTRGGMPQVTPVETGRLKWLMYEYSFAGDESLEAFEASVQEEYAGLTNSALLQLRLSGTLGIDATTRLEGILETLESRLLRVKYYREMTIAPTEEELSMLEKDETNPLIAEVARALSREASGPDTEKAAVALTALRELYAAIHQ